jgi:hypothetical protein
MVHPIATLPQMWDIIEQNKKLIVGSPQGVGFTTFISEWTAEQLFFKDISVVIVTDTEQSRIKILKAIKSNFDYYKVNGIKELSHNIYQTTNDKSTVGVFLYHEIDFGFCFDYLYDFDVIIFDKDILYKDFYDRLPELMDDIPGNVIVNTYDVPSSVFYKGEYDDITHVILTSQYSRDNIRRINPYTNVINHERITSGKFRD